jgi:hypothetical protein
MGAWRFGVLAAAGLFGLNAAAWAQESASGGGPPPGAAAAPSGGDEGFSTRDSTVGYIDSAVIATQVRLRFDAGYHFPFPSRAEFFYPQPAPGGPGEPLDDGLNSYQELSAYVEVAMTPELSGFLEVPFRWLNPDENPNGYGFSDLSFGGKYAWYSDEMFLATAQLRATVPTGDVHRNLSNGHATLEPALLCDARGLEGWGVESELRLWTPIGGTDFAGPILRYGVGVHYDLCECVGWRVAPVVELVGWTVLGGKEQPLPVDGVIPPAHDAAGETIVNAKFGVRVGLGERTDVYVGYGRALTGNTWYRDMARLELRWAY